MNKLRIIRSIGVFASVVGVVQIADALFRLLLDGVLVLAKPGAGPLLLALSIALLREVYLVRSHNRHSAFESERS